MKRCFSESDIALYLDHELDENRLHKLETHLCECRHCQELFDDFQEMQETLKELHPPVLSGPVASRMRSRIIDQVRYEEAAHPWRRRIEVAIFQGPTWRYAGVVAIVLVASIIGVWILRSEESVTIARVEPPVIDEPKREMQPVAVSPQPEPTVTHELAPRAVTVPVRSRPPEPDVVEDSGPVVVKLVTDDPNIVIYWLLDSDGGQL